MYLVTYSKCIVLQVILYFYHSRFTRYRFYKKIDFWSLLSFSSLTSKFAISTTVWCNDFCIGSFDCIFVPLSYDTMHICRYVTHVEKRRQIQSIAQQKYNLSQHFSYKINTEIYGNQNFIILFDLEFNYEQNEPILFRFRACVLEWRPKDCKWLWFLRQTRVFYK